LGFSVFLESSGAGGVPKDQVRAQIEASGRLALFGVTGPSGQGHETSFAHILQTHLGWPMDKVVYRAGDPSQELVGNGTGGSRSLYGAGSALVHLCQCIQEALKPLAQAALGASSVKWDLGHWVDEAQATQRISVAELIEHPRFSELSQTSFLGEASSGVTYPNGCHVAEIEIDPETGETCLVNYVAVDDLGRVISAQLVKGQVHGGVAQGWGQAFCEQAIYDSHGQLLTGSFMDYAMPRIGDVSRFVAETVEVPTPLNLLGSKGVGESGCTGSLPALANAMVDALRPFGVQAMDMPFTPEKVWRAIHRHAPR
jgi:carbon-monoxide dehydrogenase large subunit